MPLSECCDKCGHPSGEWILAEAALFLCESCQESFTIWTIQMDHAFVSYEYSEFLEAA